MPGVVIRNKVNTLRLIDKVATSGYKYIMDQYKTVGIKKLKNELSAYIREVKNGTVILITDHGHVVAEIKTPETEYGQIKRDAMKQEWIDSNKLFIPSKPRRKLNVVPIQMPEGTAAGLLDFERGESR